MEGVGSWELRLALGGFPAGIARQDRELGEIFVPKFSKFQLSIINYQLSTNYGFSVRDRE
jgi:hypothetical protein